MGKCIYCKSGSGHKTTCSKYKAPKEEEKKGRGITATSSDGDTHALNVCIEKLGDSTHLFYMTGGKSLVGGKNGKKSGLTDTSYRIDRQSTGNVQFQRGDLSLAGVTFLPTTPADQIIDGLRLSLRTGEMVRLGVLED